MPTYVYRNAKGEEREIQARITQMPPEFVVFDKDGNWLECGIITTPDGPPENPEAYRRVPAGGQTVNAGPVRNKYPIVSRTLPKDLPGCKTDRYGATVITSRRHEQQIAGRYGYKRSE